MRSLADRVNGPLIGGQIVLRIPLGRRRLAQHVIAIAKAAGLQFFGASEGGFYGFAGDELLAHHLHGEVGAAADDRLAEPGHEPRDGCGEIFFAVGAHQSAGDHEAPGRRIDEDGPPGA